MNTTQQNKQMIAQLYDDMCAQAKVNAQANKNVKNDNDKRFGKPIKIKVQMQINYEENVKLQNRNKFSKQRKSKNFEQIKMQRALNREYERQHKEDKIEIQQEIKRVTMQGLLDGYIPDVGPTIDKANILMNEIGITNSNMNTSVLHVTQQMTNILNKFDNKLDTFSKIFNKSINILELVSDIMYTIIHMIFAKPGYKIATLTMEAFRMLTKYGIKAPLDYFRNLVLPYMKNVTMQIDDITPAEAVSNFKDLLTPQAIVTMLFVMISGSFLTILPKKTDIEDVLKRCGDLGRATKGIKDLNDSMEGYVQVILDKVGIKLFGSIDVNAIKDINKDFEQWMNEVESFMGRYSEDEVFDIVRTNNKEKAFSIQDKILRDKATVLKVNEIYKKGMELSKKLSEMKAPQKLTFTFGKHLSFMENLMKVVDTTGAFGTRPRTQPVVIWLFGESGVGKSGMSWPLAIDMNAIYMTDKTNAKNFSQNIYMRNVEQEFWDNYQGQNVVIYDDFGQLKDTTGTPNMEFMELIRTANIAPYPLHMAHLEDKRKARFTSKVLLLTSNVFNHSVNSLTFPDAFRRRIDLCGRVYNKDEFCKSGYSASAGQAVNRLDKDKVRKEFDTIISTEVYLIDLINPENGDVLEEGLTYEEFLDRAITKSNKCFKESTELNEYLEKYAYDRFDDINKRVNMQIDDDEYLSAVEEAFCDTVQYEHEKQKWFANGGGHYTWMKHNIKRAAIETADNLVHSLLTDDQIEKLMTYKDIGIHVFDTKTNELIVNPAKEFYNNAIYSIHDARKYAAEHWYTKITQIQEEARESVNKCKEVAASAFDEVTNYIKDHPFYTFAAVLGLIVALFGMFKIWRMLFPKEKKIVKVPEFKIGNNVTLTALDERIRGLDLRGMSKESLRSFIRHVLTTSTSVVILSKAYGSVLEIIEDIAKRRSDEILVMVDDTVFNYRGIEYQLQEDTVPLQSILVKDANLNIPNIVPPKPVLEAQPSGDAITIQKPKVIVEAQPSGDAITLQKPKVVLEAQPSGDVTTLQKPKIHMEAVTSGDAITLAKAKPIHLEDFSVDADMQMWKDQVAQNLITNRIFNNLYKISKIKKDGDIQPLLNGLFVRGSVMLVPGHFRSFISKEDTLEIRSIWDCKFEVPMKDVKIIPIVNPIGEEKEAILMVFPKYVNAHSDLVKHFSDSESMNKYKRADVCLPLIRYSDKVKKFLMMILGNHECRAYDREVYLHDAKKGNFILRQGLEYKCPTIAGDCGAPVIINETAVLRKIAGIHVAGDTSGMAYAESVTRKDLERALSKISVEMQIRVDLDGMCAFKNFDQVPLNEEFGVENLTNFCNLPSMKLIPLGRVSEKLYEPGTTEIRPSLVHGMISEIKTKPAHLRDVVKDGQHINIKHKNVLKNAMDTPYISKDLIDMAYRQVKTQWLKNIRPEMQRILTWEETVCGSEMSDYTSAMNRSTSPGYPWILHKPPGSMGKQGWFGKDEYILNEEVHQAVLYRIEQAKKGIRVPTLWVDTLKDERRPIEKVDQLKTRVFNNGPMDFNLAFRMYFLPFIAHLMENRITNEVSIGTNVYSQDWKKTALKLMEKGDKIIAGDFSSFDGSLNSCIMERFADLANDFFCDGPENALIRKVLLQEVYNSVHLCGDSIYMTTHSQPSGNPATTPMNCFINSMGVRICYHLLATFQGLCMKSFNKHVSMVSYGDDNVINFSDEVSSWFNMETLTQAFAQIGFTYTDELKSTNGKVPNWRHISEVAYLKRKFRKDEERGVWEAPLTLDIILEMPNWCRGSLDIYEGTRINCETAIMELSMHPREIFDEWSVKIEEAFRKQTGDYLDIDVYQGYAQQRYMDYYLN